MEADIIIGYRELVRHLSVLIAEKKVPINKYRSEICEIFVEFAKKNTLKGMADPLKLFHQLQDHQDSTLKLECGASHCIECYYFFCKDDNWDPNNVFCTCDRKIVPKYRSSVENNYKRIQGLKAKCVNCNSIKDKMNFAVISLHPCVLCSNCIKETYVYEKGKKNSCRMCGQEYNEECELIIRSVYENNLDQEIVSKFYSEECERCKKQKDSRQFSETCEDHHIACRECIKEKEKQNDGNCWCGLPISILK